MNRFSCDPTKFSEFLTSNFNGMYKNATPSFTPPELLQIQNNLDLCHNFNLKKTLLMIEEKGYMNSANIFKWKACFDAPDPKTFCPERIKTSIQERPQSAYYLLQVLKGHHYKIRNYINTTMAIVDVMGGALNSNFDINLVTEGAAMYPMMNSQFGRENDVILQASQSEGPQMDDQDNVDGHNLMIRHINDNKIVIMAQIDKPQRIEDISVNNHSLNLETQNSLSQSNSQLNRSRRRNLSSSLRYRIMI